MLQTYVKADFVSLFHSLVMTPGVGLLCLWGGGVVPCLLGFVHDLSSVTVLSNRDNFILGTMTATIVMMSAAIVQKKMLFCFCFHLPSWTAILVGPCIDFAYHLSL